MKDKFKEVYKNLVFNLAANNNPVYLGFYKYFYNPKKGSLKDFIDYYSRNNKNISVVQVGANDGFNHDPIFKFIKRDNWKGVLLEPQPQVYHKFLKKLHKKSKGIHTVNAALDYTDGQRTMYTISFSDSRWATGLASFNKEAVMNSLVSDHVRENAKREGVVIPQNLEDGIKEVKIDTISPPTLLKEYNLSKIDWLQVDAEGFDHEIIRMFDISKTLPRVIIFEHHQINSNEKKEIYDHLSLNHYSFKEYGRDLLALYKPEEKYKKFVEN